jgi:hypothetical protein
MTPLSAIMTFIGVFMMIFPAIQITVNPKYKLWAFQNLGKVVIIMACGAIVAITGAFV